MHYLVSKRPVAWAAFLRYSKARHPARLDLDDCVTWAVAKLSASPLLCAGDDFAQTDLELVTRKSPTR